MGVPQGVIGTITAVAAAPRVERGPGRVVLTTVSHLNNFVFSLTLQNAAGQTDTLGVTGYHKFYDQAEGWQSVVDLTVGDALRGRDGQTVTVVDVTRDAGTHRVYNMTVEADHVYFVGDLTTLTHNTCPGQHHFTPKSWGNEIPYKHRYLPDLDSIDHTKIHKAFSDFLDGETGYRFMSMSGERWIAKFGEHRLNQLSHEFHKMYSTTADGHAIAKNIIAKGTFGTNPNLTLFEMFKAQYRYARKMGYMVLP